MRNMLVEYKDWQLTVDKLTTATVYGRVQTGGAESCGCVDCQNFATQRTTVYPAEIKELLESLGVDWKKEVEVSHYARLENDDHYYGGWFHFKGDFVGFNCERTTSSDGFTLELTDITPKFSIGFRRANSLTAFNKADRLVQVEFECKVPWVLDRQLEQK
ncbi:MAG: hypothetical protein RIE59_27685 [Imperialibacter sp.]